MEFENREICPVCYEQLLEKSRFLFEKQRVFCRCKNCGAYEISELVDLSSLEKNTAKRAVLSHAIWRMARNGTPFITPQLAYGILMQPLPTATEQCDRLLLWLSPVT
jgi:hypothetical protein